MSKHILFSMSLICILLLPFMVWGDAPARNAQTPYRFHSAVMGGAGGTIGSASQRNRSTLGQPTPVGKCTSETLRLDAGFWPGYATGFPTAIVSGPPVLENRLYQNYPNPFNPTTTIEYSVAIPSPVELVIFNVKGQRIRQLVDGVTPAGHHTVTWEGRSDAGAPVASGVYFYRLRVGGEYRAVKKMIILK